MHALQRVFRAGAVAWLAAFLAACAASPPAGAAPVPDASPAVPGATVAIGDQLAEYLRGVDGTWGVAVIDIPSGQVAGWNERHVFRTASTMKLPLAMYVLDRAAAGALSLDEEMELQEEDWEDGTGVLQDEEAGSRWRIGRLVELAITRSDNIAANMLLRRVGADNVWAYEERLGAAVTHDEEGRFVTTPLDMARFLYALWAGQALPPTETDRLVELLSHTAFTDRLAAGMPAGVTVAHKIGTLPGMVHDVGLVFAPGRTFVLAVMSEGVSDPDVAAAVIAGLGRMVYNIEVKLADGGAPAG